MMIIWEPSVEGYLECFVGAYYGVVGLAPHRTGWVARLESPVIQQIAPVLYNTAFEAKAWVEARIHEQFSVDQVPVGALGMLA